MLTITKALNKSLKGQWCQTKSLSSFGITRSLTSSQKRQGTITITSIRWWDWHLRISSISQSENRESNSRKELPNLIDYKVRNTEATKEGKEHWFKKLDSCKWKVVFIKRIVILQVLITRATFQTIMETSIQSKHHYITLLAGVPIPLSSRAIWCPEETITPSFQDKRWWLKALKDRRTLKAISANLCPWSNSRLAAKANKDKLERFEKDAHTCWNWLRNNNSNKNLNCLLREADRAQ